MPIPHDFHCSYLLIPIWTRRLNGVQKCIGYPKVDYPNIQFIAQTEIWFDTDNGIILRISNRKQSIGNCKL